MCAGEIPGLGEHANTIWTPGEMVRLGRSLQGLLERAASGAKSRVLFLVPPNNKCSGPLYEMVLMLDTWLRRRRVRDSIELGFTTYEAHYNSSLRPASARGRESRVR
jgi:hypothetical protein